MKQTTLPHIERDQSTETPTLRDQFAMAANEQDIEEIMHLNSEYISGEGFANGYYKCKITRYQARYLVADAMMEARK